MKGQKMTARRKRIVLVTALAAIVLPALVVAFDAVAYHVRNRNNGAIISSGEKREYLLYVPGTYDSSTPTPLVISMHGGGGWPAMQRDVSKWNGVAERHGFIVVYPAGVDGAAVRAWRVWSGPGLMKDVRFISDLIDSLEADLNIDPNRIYANGLSNGGAMAFVLSCTLADRFAAIGMVAAAHTLPWDWCPDRRPVPMIAFHGTEDSIVPYGGGKSWVGPMSFPDARSWAEQWARRNRCGHSPIKRELASAVTSLEYGDCADAADVVLHTIEGGGHTWPGGKRLPEWFAGATNMEVDASELMWQFFREHPSGELGRRDDPDFLPTADSRLGN